MTTTSNTPEKTPSPNRRMALLEARLGAMAPPPSPSTRAPILPATPPVAPIAPMSAASSADHTAHNHTPVTPRRAATPPTGITPATLARTSAVPSTPVPLRLETSDSVHSFSSDGTLTRGPSTSSAMAGAASAGAANATTATGAAGGNTAASANSRRKYAPPPRIAKAPARKRKRQSPMGKRNGRVDDYFKPAGSSARRPLGRHDAGVSGDTRDTPPMRGDDMGGDAYRHLREMVDKLTIENAALRGAANECDDLRAKNEDLCTQVELELPDLRMAVADKEEVIRVMEERSKALEHMLKATSIRGEELRRAVAERAAFVDGERLGRAVVERAGMAATEVWQDGREWREVDDGLAQVNEEREAVERQRRDLVRRKRRDSSSTAEGDAQVLITANGAATSPTSYEDTAEYMLEQEEVFRVRLQVLKRREVALAERQTRLGRERDCLVRELRRQSDEKQSRFGECPTVNSRYVLLNLLGKGGFSEVFKAMDLKTSVHVACKIHQLSSNWSEEKKRNFIKHAMREYEIHKSLKHARVVQLVDIFEIDENSFCTVLEYCDGCDLDSYLRMHKTLNEREAKCIISQVFAGLLYLAEQKRRIIHYDLKPGNILLRDGQVQITDFGLSKIMSETESTVDGMELTSQGAGTMWYLPPECFETASQARISNKVDVWSAGVILFQMLYGRKPFGHDQSQEKMFREKTVQRQTLAFPSKPHVSDAAKQFMTLCLTRKATARPDVRQMLLHLFIRRK